MFITVSHSSSTALHILLHINIIYTIFWFIVEIPLFAFKYYHLPYATSAFGVEVAIIFMLCFNEFMREFFGIKGNLKLQIGLLIIFILYGLFSAVGFVFFLVLQSYAQRPEIILSSIGLALIITEILLSIITIVLSKRNKPKLTNDQKRQRYEDAQQRFQSSIKSE